MSSTWTSGGDLTALNQILNDPLKGRYTDELIGYAKGTEGGTGDSGVATATHNRQVVESRGHPYSLLGRDNFDIGGRFLSLKAEVPVRGRQIAVRRNYGGSPPYITYWEGRMLASSEAASILDASQGSASDERSYLASKVPSVSTADMYAAGATAINRCAPTNPLVDLSTSFAELLREGLPSIPGRGGGAGGEYLNYQFGIAPLVSDIRDFRRVLADADALYEQYERNSGKHIRRRYRFPVVREQSQTTKTGQAPKMVRVTRPNGSKDSIGYSGAHVRAGTLSQITTTETRIWFSGAFTYYLPKSGWRREMDRLDRLYGLKPGVDTLYQLTPWSWLVDYFSNLGDVIENINAFSSDGLVMPYGYVMAQKTVTITSKLDFGLWNGTAFAPSSVGDTVVLTSKRRLPASPFGFGFSDGSLTPKQWSILAALGLTRR